MSPKILLGVVVVQVLAFQFGSIRLTRALPDYLVGTEGLPPGLLSRVQQFKQGAGRFRYGLGAGLLLAAIVCAFIIPFDYGMAKLSLAVISVVSSVALGIGFLHDGRAVGSISAMLPEPAVRSARLERRRLRLHYPPICEVLPVAILLATVAFTAIAAEGHSVENSRIYPIPIVQGIFVLASLSLSLRLARSKPGLPQRSKAFLGTPEEGVRVDEALRTLDLRFFMAARTAIALMLGLIQSETVISATGQRPPGLLIISDWILVIILLGLFVGYTLRATGVRKRLLS